MMDLHKDYEHKCNTGKCRQKKSLCNHSEGFLNKMSPRFKLFESFVVNL